MLSLLHSNILQWQHSRKPEILINGAHASEVEYNTAAFAKACTSAQSFRSCLTLCDPVDCSPPGSSVRGVLQERILEWVAISFSRGSSQPRDRAQVSHIADTLSLMFCRPFSFRNLFYCCKIYNIKFAILKC